MESINILSQLNPAQAEAVKIQSGPILVLAGAGSGKTRVLTYRLAYLIESGVEPAQILAVTFTNKAAKEMKGRVHQLLAGRTTSEPFIGTFHSFGVRLLRQEINWLGYKQSFNIYDQIDQQAVVKEALRDLNLSPENFQPQKILHYISEAKNKLLTPENFEAQAETYLQEVTAKVFYHYQEILKRNNALDFDDLIILPTKLFREFPEILAKYQRQYQHLLVDEYQDTNLPQYRLIKYLAKKSQNICVVGDDWQSIYGWRGADIRNILSFERDFPAAKIIKLEQNYRSTQNILDAAHHLITQNPNQMSKELWTKNPTGAPIKIYQARHQNDEAQFIIDRLKNERTTLGFSLNQAVILYRTNAQSRSIEEAFLRANLPYQIVGSVNFYARAEIKDTLAYLKLLLSPEDSVSLKRIINHPPRGIGDQTIAHLTAYAQKCQLNLYQAALQADKNEFLKPRAQKALREFTDMVEGLKKKAQRASTLDIFDLVLAHSGLTELYHHDDDEEKTVRWENILELKTVLKKFDLPQGLDGLRAFLEEISLLSDLDQIEDQSQKVTLMTMHCAKGLEFDYVFITGAEEGIFPHSRSLVDPAELEEERRLAYVAMTRAKKELYLIHSLERRLFGSLTANPPSRFLEDIPARLIKKISYHAQQPFYRRGYRGYEEGGAGSTDRSYPHGPQGTKETSKTAFADGQAVTHPQFGRGVVLSTTGSVIQVAFKTAGVKKLAVGIAPLKPV